MPIDYSTVELAGKRGPGWAADIVIDDIRFVRDQRNAVFASDCIFEHDTCQMFYQSKEGEFDWIAISDSARFTRPDRAADGQYHLYTEVQNLQQYSAGILRTHPLILSGRNGFTFTYCMDDKGQKAWASCGGSGRWEDRFLPDRRSRPRLANRNDLLPRTCGPACGGVYWSKRGDRLFRDRH